MATFIEGGLYDTSAGANLTCPFLSSSTFKH